MEQLSKTAAHQRIVAITHLIRGIDESVGREQWQLGELLKEVVRDSLYAAAGFNTLADWLDSDGVYVSPSSARRAMLLATHFSEDMAARFGGRKLAAVLTYMELTEREERAGDALALTFRERQPNGRYKSVAFVDASGRRIERACTGLRREQLGQKERGLLGSHDPAIRQQLVDARATADAMASALPGSRVRFQRRKKDGQIVWTFGAIAEKDLPALIAELQARLVKAKG
jgi:hypothetical protein